MRNWFRRREYKSGTAWGWWLWTEVPTDYILRLHIIKTPFGAVCLHWGNGPDPEPHLHDHPVTFASFVLKGWYRELRWPPGFGGFAYSITRRWFNFIRARRDDRHRIVEVAPGGFLTLCFMGPKRQEWGFHTPEGWVYWKNYNREKYG